MTSDPTGSVRLIVGLGNFPGSYHHTPHNIGFHALDVLAENRRSDWREGEEFLSASAGDRQWLLKPASYMNTSGRAVQLASKKWNVPAPALLVVCDDFALPWGRLRFRRSGSAGGHNGLKSIIEHVGSDQFPRLRIGVGPVPPEMDSKDFVLRRQPKERIMALAAKAAEALDACLETGVEAAMNRFNAAEQ
jgi:peptidyl-tRNA hydrolase, PTH1 family